MSVRILSEAEVSHFRPEDDMDAAVDVRKLCDSHEALRARVAELEAERDGLRDRLDDAQQDLADAPRACCGEYETGSGEHGDECEIFRLREVLAAARRAVVDDSVRHRVNSACAGRVDWRPPIPGCAVCGLLEVIAAYDASKEQSDAG